MSNRDSFLFAWNPWDGQARVRMRAPVYCCEQFGALLPQYLVKIQVVDVAKTSLEFHRASFGQRTGEILTNFRYAAIGYR